MDSFGETVFFVFKIIIFLILGVIMLPAVGLVLLFLDPWMSLIKD